MFWRPSKPKARGISPFDLDGAENITRFGQSPIPRPTPPTVGLVSGFMPMQDTIVYYGMLKRKPFGPNVNSVPINLQFQITVPEMFKA